MFRHNANPASRVASFVLGLVCGLVAGGLLGILYAPHRGDITRRKLRRRAEEVRDQVDEAVQGASGR